jgi:hypothetical protein
VSADQLLGRVIAGRASALRPLSMAARADATHLPESSSVVEEQEVRKFGSGAMLAGGLAGGRMPCVGATAAAAAVCTTGGGGAGAGVAGAGAIVVGGVGGTVVVGAGGAGGAVVVGTARWPLHTGVGGTPPRAMATSPVLFRRVSVADLGVTITAARATSSTAITT